MASALSLIGVQLNARQQSVQILPLTQAATLGVLVGVIFAQVLNLSENLILSSVFGLAFSFVFYGFMERFLKNTILQKNSYYVGFFAILLSATYLLISLSPRLESHVAASHFGDLSLIAPVEAIWIAVSAVIILFILYRIWRPVTAWSFHSIIHEDVKSLEGIKKYNFTFLFLVVLSISISVQLLGLLFTLASLILPSLFLSHPGDSLKRYLIKMAFLPPLVTLVGFSISLAYLDLPSVPIIVMTYLVLATVVRFKLS